MVAESTCAWERPRHGHDVRAHAVVIAAFGPVAPSKLRALCAIMPPDGTVTVISESGVTAPACARNVAADTSRANADCNSIHNTEAGHLSSDDSAHEQNPSQTTSSTTRQSDYVNTKGEASADALRAGESADSSRCAFRWVQGHPASATMLAQAGAAGADTVMVAGIDDWDDEEADVQVCNTCCKARSHLSACIGNALSSCTPRRQLQS